MKKKVNSFLYTVALIGPPDSSLVCILPISPCDSEKCVCRHPCLLILPNLDVFWFTFVTCLGWEALVLVHLKKYCLGK